MYPQAPLRDWKSVPSSAAALLLLCQMQTASPSHLSAHGQRILTVVAMQAAS